MKEIKLRWTFNCDYGIDNPAVSVSVYYKSKCQKMHDIGKRWFLQTGVEE